MPRTVVITGASSGIGAALATTLAARGDTLALLARRADRLQRVADEARLAAERADHTAAISIHPVDVTERDAVRRILAEVETTHQAIDVLVLNAGVGESSPVAHYSDRLAARVLEVNAIAPLYAIAAVLPGMLRRREGHLVGVSSLASYRGMPGVSAYCASKAALSTLLESLRLDLRTHGIAVTTVSPGYVRTPMTANAERKLPFLLEPEDAARRIVRGIDRRQREVRFPWPAAAAVRLLRALPDPLFDFALSRLGLR